MARELIDIACKIVRRTDLAIAVADGTPDPDKPGRDKWFWLPLSQVEDNGDGTVTLPVWLAEKEGLI